MNYDKERDVFTSEGARLNGHSVENMAKQRSKSLSEAEQHKPQPKFQHIADELGGVAFRPRTFNPVIINGPARADGASWFTITDKANTDAAEILIYDQIGKDWWSGEGTGAKDFVEALQKLDATKQRALKVRINSPGGNVYDGLAIATNLREWKGKVDTFNDGLAASIASVILLATANGGKVHAGKASSTMIHKASTVAMGTVDDMQRAISALEAAEKNIIAAYQKKAPHRTEQELTDAMAKETWFTGPEAKEFGFVDEVTDTAPISNNFNISNFKRVPEAFRKLQNSAAQGGGQDNSIMNKEEIIALLKEHGITADANATIEQLKAQLKEVLAKAKAPTPPTPTPAPAANPTEAAALLLVQNELKAMRDARDKERRANVTTRVDALIAERRVTASERDFLIESAMADERHLVNAAARPQVLPPEGITPVIETSASAQDVGRHILAIGKEIIADIEAHSDKRASEKSKARAREIRKHEAKLLEVFNEGTNTVDTQLKQDVIIDIGLRAFARRLAPITKFCTLFSSVPLRGTNKIQVPFLDLDSTTPTAWNASNGYVAGDTTNDNREITVDKDYYLGVQVTSEEVARQPFLMLAQQVGLKAESLAFYIWKDFLALFTTANSNFSIATGWPKSAGAMESNSIADLQKLADDLNWPDASRLLFVNSAYNNALMKDNAFKLAVNIGGTDVMRRGVIPDIYGFEYSKNSNLQDNSINLAGVIATKAAALFASAPIAPTKELMNAGTQYSIAVDPDTGIPLEYTAFAEPKYNRFQRVVQARWGKAVGNTNAALLLTTP